MEIIYLYHFKELNSIKIVVQSYTEVCRGPQMNKKVHWPNCCFCQI